MSDKRLQNALTDLEQAREELRGLETHLERTQAEMTKARRVAATVLQDVPVAELAAAAVHQTAARAQVDGLEAAAEELRRRVGVAGEKVKTMRARWAALAVEAAQADLDRESVEILDALAAVVERLRAQRAREEALHAEFSLWPRVTFGPPFAQRIIDKIAWERNQEWYRVKHEA